MVSAGVRHRGADPSFCEHPAGAVETASQNRSDRSRQAAADSARLAAWRATRVLDGEHSERSPGGYEAGPNGSVGRPASERVALENRIENLLCLLGSTGFKPRLKKTAVRRHQLRRAAGSASAPTAVDGGERLPGRHRLLREHIGEVAAARVQTAASAETDHVVPQMHMPTRLVGFVLSTRNRFHAVGVQPFVRRSPRAFRICGAHPHTDPQPWQRTRSAHQPQRQCTGAPYPVAVGLAVAALSAGQRIESLVPRAHLAVSRDASTRSWWWRSPLSCWCRCCATASTGGLVAAIAPALLDIIQTRRHRRPES